MQVLSPGPFASVAQRTSVPVLTGRMHVRIVSEAPRGLAQSGQSARFGTERSSVRIRQPRPLWAISRMVERLAYTQKKRVRFLHRLPDFERSSKEGHLPFKQGNAGSNPVRSANCFCSSTG